MNENFYNNSKGEASHSLLDEDFRNAWIPCSVSQPGFSKSGNQQFIVTIKYKSGIRRTSIELWDYDTKIWATSVKVIAWQPLPEPYQENI